MAVTVWSAIRPAPVIEFPTAQIEELIAQLGIPARIIEESQRSPKYSSALADSKSFVGSCPTVTVGSLNDKS